MDSPHPRLSTEEEGGKVKAMAEEAVGTEDNITAEVEEEEAVGIPLIKEAEAIEDVEGEEAITTAGTEAEVAGDTATAGAGVTITEVRAIMASIRTVERAGSTPGWWRIPGPSWRRKRSTVRRTRGRVGHTTRGR